MSAERVHQRASTSGGRARLNNTSDFFVGVRFKCFIHQTEPKIHDACPPVLGGILHCCISN